MKAARNLSWTRCVIAVLAMPGCDASPADAVARLKQVFAARPVVADAVNAFLAADQAIVFNHPESHKYRRQAFPY